MKLPTDEQSGAARAWLEQWVPGYTTGQWAALAELLAAQTGPARAAGRKGMYVFVRRVPGDAELDGTAAELYAACLEDALERARQLGAGLGGELRHVGFFVDPLGSGRTFEAAVPYEELPPWAKSWIDQQREAAVAKSKPRARKRKAA